jgi:predicted nucleotidyltransferase
LTFDDAAFASFNAGMATSGFLPEIAARKVQLAELCLRSNARRLHLFGSATRADFHPEDSDLDFLVEFEEDMPPAAYSQAFFSLKRGLESLFHRPVDLLTPEALRNPYLRRRIESEQISVYGT